MKIDLYDSDREILEKLLKFMKENEIDIEFHAYSEGSFVDIVMDDRLICTLGCSRLTSEIGSILKESEG